MTLTVNVTLIAVAMATAIVTVKPGFHIIVSNARIVTDTQNL